ncbi:MAG: hypothetical protein ACRC3Z_00225 [Phocaeicola sp.]
MKKRNFYACALLACAAAFTACSNSNDLPGSSDTNPDFEGNQDRNYFNIVLGVGDDGNDGVYIQAQEDVATGTIGFRGFGFEVPSTRTARVNSSEDGKYVYSLDYGGGTISKYQVNGGQSYTNINTLSISLAVGSTNPRWSKVNDETALLHNVTVTRQYKDEAGTEYDYSRAMASLVAVNLGEESNGMSLGAVQQIEIPRSQEDIDRNLNIWRIDAPVVTGNKAYYGVAKRSYNPETAENITLTDYYSTMLVADYPSLTNLKVISSSICTGENYGYRTPPAHVVENGDIYQMVGNGQKAKVLRITNEAYDNTYDFDLSAALGQEVGSLGWFYVGNSIGYALVYDLAQGQGEAESAWGVARIDLANQTAVKMNLNFPLWLRQYQNGVLKDGKFHMALAPVGENGAIYMFDPSSTSADAFTIGATLENLGGQFYIGVY